MNERCPGCSAHHAKLSDEERARLPLRDAAHKWRESTEALFDVVRAHGWGHPLVEAADAAVNAADEVMVQAAIAYAATRGAKP